MLESKHPPPISILTPVLNRGSYIAEAIDSVGTRNCPAVGHITLDVGAVDGTTEILARYSHLSMIREPDESAHKAVNTGIKLARGEIIGFLNSDDMYAEGVPREVGRRFGADLNLGMVCGGD